MRIIRLARWSAAVGVMALMSTSCGEVLEDIVYDIFLGDSVDVRKGDATAPTAFLLILSPGPVTLVDAASGPVRVTVPRPTDQIAVLGFAEDPEGIREIHLEVLPILICETGSLGVAEPFGPSRSIVRSGAPGERSTTRLAFPYAKYSVAAGAGKPPSRPRAR